MTISTGSIVHDATLMLRSIIGSAIVATGSCLTAYPHKNVVYPFAVLEVNRGPTQILGAWNQGRIMPLRAMVTVYTKDSLTMDAMADKIYDQLRNMQLNGGSGTIGSSLYDFQLIDEHREDEIGRDGIHKKIQVYEYKFVAVP